MTQGFFNLDAFKDYLSWAYIFCENLLVNKNIIIIQFFNFSLFLEVIIGITVTA